MSKELLTEPSVATSTTTRPVAKSYQSLPELQMLQAFLAKNIFVQFFALQWVDYAGLLRERCIPTSRMVSLLKDGEHVHIGLSYLVMHVGDCNVAQEVPEVDEYGMLVPDINSLRICTYRPSRARIMCSVQSETKMCPRQLLISTMERLASESVKMQLGLEMEFMLTTPEGIPITTSGSSTATLSCVGENIVEESVNLLTKASIEVEQFHKESGCGQYEITLRHSSPLSAIDDWYYAVEVVRNVAHKHNARFTLHPKPLDAEELGTGAHMNLSIEGSAEEVSRRFFAGVLRRLKSLCAILLPTLGSYARTNGVFVSALNSTTWRRCMMDVRNKLCPVRKKFYLGDVWEIRCIDATCNMYTALAAIMCAGHLGLRDFEPGEVEDIVKDDSQKLELPISLTESLSFFSEDRVLRRFLGEDFAKIYILYKKTELEVLEPKYGQQWAIMLAATY